MSSAIEICQLSKSFGEKSIFENLNASFDLGKMHVLLGPSGIGKTTLMRLLLGLEEPQAGHIDGIPTSYSVVFQENRLAENLSLSANVRLASGCTLQRAHELLEELGLGGEKGPVRNLSGGQKRRVALARALAHEAELYIFDEALQGIDKRTKKQVAQVINKTIAGSTVFFVTHDESDLLLLENPCVWRMSAGNGSAILACEILPE